MNRKLSAVKFVSLTAILSILVSMISFSLLSGSQEMAENFVLYSTGGERRIFHTMTGKLPSGGIIIVNFTSIHCLPCRKEIPELVSMREQHGDKLSLICIFGETGEPVKKLAIELGVPDRAYVDPLGSINRLFNIKSIPTTILVDGKNRVLGRFVGYNHKNMEAIRQLVK